MTRKRAGRLSRREAERTLTDPAGSDSALSTVLSAAAGPARPDELRGEDAMVAAFHASRLAAPPAARDRYVSPRRLAGRATTRLVVAAGAVLALGSGGLALAMGAQLDDLTGLLPDRMRSAGSPSGSPSSDDPSSSTSPGSEEHGAQGGKGDTGKKDGKGDTGKKGEGSGRPDGATPGSQADPQADRVLQRACRDLLRPGQERGHDDNLALLVERAGGADRVEAFCIDLLGTTPVTPGKPDKPTKPEKPTKPAKPEKPTKPDKPTQPTKPSKPTQPTKPTQAAQPTKPAKPTQAAQPDKPDKPETPSKPDKPANPDKPAKPSKPAKASKTSTAEQPGHTDPQTNHSRSGGPMTPG